MREADAGWMKDLLAEHVPPCVSLYQPVHRAGPPAMEDAVRFRNLVDRAEESLKRRYAGEVVREIVEKLRSAEEEFNPHGGDRDGVAVFASRDFFRVVMLQDAVAELVEVADSFHIKPLIRLIQSAGRFQVLCLMQKQVELYEGTRYRLSRVELRNVPRNMNIVSGMTLSQEVASGVDMLEAQAQLPNEGQLAQPPATLERFFRAVDKGVWENYSRVSQLPLILAAVERYHPMFHRISINPFLLDEGIRMDPKRMDAQRLKEEAWRIMQPRYRAELDKLADQFRSAKAHGRGSDELFQVTEAVITGRVGTLLVEAGKQVPGRLHRASGLIEPADLKNPHADDVLDDLAEMVLKMDGQVMVLGSEEMPTVTGVAGIYRY